MIRAEKKKLGKFVFLGVILGVVVFIVSYVYFAPFTLPKRLVAVGEKILSRSFGTPVTMKRVQLNLFRPGIIVEGLQIPEVALGPEGGEGSILVHRAEFELERFQVLSGNIAFRRVLLKRPEIRYQITEGKEDQAKRSAGSRMGSNSFSRAPRMGRIEVQGGSLQLHWPGNGLAVQTEILDFLFAPPSIRRKGKVRLRTQFGEISWRERSTPLIKFEVDADVSGSRAWVHSLALIADSAELFASGELEGNERLHSAIGTFHGRLGSDFIGPGRGEWGVKGDLIFQGDGAWSEENWKVLTSLAGTRVGTAGLEIPLLGGEIHLSPAGMEFNDFRIGVIPPTGNQGGEPVPLGELMIDGNIQAESPHIYNLNVMLGGIKAAEIAASIPGMNREIISQYLWAIGALNGNLHLKGYFPSGAIDPRTVAFQGSADLNILSGLEGWELIHMYSEFAHEEKVFRLDSLSLSSFKGQLEGHGEIDPRGEVSISFVVDPVDLSLLGRLREREIEGKGFLEGTVTGNIRQPVFEGEVDLAQVRIRGFDLGTVRGQLRYATDSGLHASQLAIRPPDAEGEIILAGFLGSDSLDISLWGERVPIQRLLKGEKNLSGTAEGRVCLSGKYPDIEGRGNITIRDGAWWGSWGRTNFDALEVSFLVENHEIQIEHATLSQGGGRISLSGMVDPRSKKIDATVQAQSVQPDRFPYLAAYLKGWGIETGGPVEVEGRVKGTYDPRPELFGKIELGVKNFALGEERSDLSIIVSLEGEKASLRGGMPGIGINGELSFAGDLPLKVKAEFNEFDFSPWLSRVCNTQDMKGVVGGELGLTASLRQPGSLEMSVALPLLELGRIDYYLKNREPIRLTRKSSGWEFPGAEFTAVSPSLRSAGGNTGTLLVSGSRAGVLTASGAVDLYWIAPFWIDMLNGSGEVALEVSFRKNGMHPGSSPGEEAEGFPIAWEGTAELKHTSFLLSFFEQKFEEVSGRVNFNDREVKWDSLKGKSEGGTFDSDGSIFLSDPVLLDLGFRVNGVMLGVVPWFPMRVRGSVRLSGDPDALTLVGEGEVIQARVSRSINMQMMVESFHMRRYQPTAESMGKPSLTFDVHITSEGNVIVSNNVAEAELRGDVYLRGNEFQPELVGVLEAVEGRVFFRDNIFSIQSGRIEFLEHTRPGEEIDPWIEMLAEANRETSQGEPFTIILKADGPLSDLKVRLSSDPAREERDILAFLAYGRFLEELQGQETEITAVEAGSLVVGQAIDSLEGKLESLTGIDQVQIEPAFSESTNTAFPRLLVRKKVGDQLDLTLTTEIGGTMSRNFLADYHFADWFSLQVNWDNENTQNEIGNFGADLKMKIPFQ